MKLNTLLLSAAIALSPFVALADRDEGLTAKPEAKTESPAKRIPATPPVPRYYKMALPMSCGPTTEVIANISSTEYAEQLAFAGVNGTADKDNTYTTTVYLNVKTRTFTVLFTDLTRDRSCVVSAGDSGILQMPTKVSKQSYQPKTKS